MLKDRRFNSVGFTLFAISIAAALLCRVFTTNSVPAIGLVLLGLYLLFAVKIVDQ